MSGFRKGPRAPGRRRSGARRSNARRPPACSGADGGQHVVRHQRARGAPGVSCGSGRPGAAWTATTDRRPFARRRAIWRPRLSRGALGPQAAGLALAERRARSSPGRPSGPDRFRLRPPPRPRPPVGNAPGTGRVAITSASRSNEGRRPGGRYASGTPRLRSPGFRSGRRGTRAAGHGRGGRGRTGCGRLRSGLGLRPRRRLHLGGGRYDIAGGPRWPRRRPRPGRPRSFGRTGAAPLGLPASASSHSSSGGTRRTIGPPCVAAPADAPTPPPLPPAPGRTHRPVWPTTAGTADRCGFDQPRKVVLRVAGPVRQRRGAAPASTDRALPSETERALPSVAVVTLSATPSAASPPTREGA